MLNSLLLHFTSAQHGEPVIELGVGLARRSHARIRGITLIDTRRLTSLTTAEASCYAHRELDRLLQVENEQDILRAQLSQACLTAGLDFDLRRVRGNPVDVLSTESQFHDLVVTAFPSCAALQPSDHSLSPSDLVDLLFQGVEPLMVLRSPRQAIRRVLLVGDGTASAARAIRSFVKQNPVANAELRLLAIGRTELKARETLREMADYCSSHKLYFESGWLCGSPRRVVIPYAKKWGADLVVLGVRRTGRVFRRLWGEPAESILRSTELALYAAT